MLKKRGHPRRRNGVVTACVDVLPSGGGDCADYIAKHGKLSEKHARVKFAQIIDAVDYCHHCRVVHRDLKVSQHAPSCRQPSR